MRNIININERGTLTLPKALRRKLGLEKKGQVIAEETDHGVILQPVAAFPIEIYTDERIAEFQKNNEDALKGFSLKKRRECFWMRTSSFLPHCRKVVCDI
jgi:bifunctional DNA-binding transcriptional regulator/antitoxin component of YhaV-PrlF toxin-antitoxin module